MYACSGLPRQHVAHGDEEDRQAQDQADPEAPAHVRQLGVGASSARDGARLQGHAALRAGAGMVLTTLRDASGRCRRRTWGPRPRMAGRARVAGGIGREFDVQEGSRNSKYGLRGSRDAGAVAGSTVMPQTGSTAAGGARDREIGLRPSSCLFVSGSSGSWQTSFRIGCFPSAAGQRPARLLAVWSAFYPHGSAGRPGRNCSWKPTRTLLSPKAGFADSHHYPQL